MSKSQVREPAAAFDVSAYIVHKIGPTTSSKLQKLLYYAQAWSLVWKGRPLYREKMFAWQVGPIVNPVFDTYRDKFKVDSIPEGNRANLSKSDKTTIKTVLHFYGDKTAQVLNDIIHMEGVTKKVVNNVKSGKSTSLEITHKMLSKHYG